MKWICLLATLICSLSAQARVVPQQIEASQIKQISSRFSGIFATRTASDPLALGEDFELESSAILQDLKGGELQKLDPDTSDYLLDSTLTLKKGLYWNIDFSISTVLPIPSNLVSGFAFDVEHTKKFNTFTLKSDIYISHYNLNDILNIESVGLTAIAYKSFSKFHLGLGANLESISSRYNQNFLNSQLSTSESDKVEFFETALVGKLSTRFKTLKLTATYFYKGKDNSLYNLTLGKRF